MRIQHHFETKRATALREAAQIDTLLRGLNEAAEKLDADIATEEERAGDHRSGQRCLSNSGARADRTPQEFEGDDCHVRTAARDTQANFS